MHLLGHEPLQCRGTVIYLSIRICQMTSYCVCYLIPQQTDLSRDIAKDQGLTETFQTGVTNLQGFFDLSNF